MAKKIKDMTDEEIDKEFNREYKRTWLKWRRLKRISAWLTIIVCVPIIIFLAWNIITIVAGMIIYY